MDLRERSLNPEERLTRQGEASPSGITDVIVIGASAGGHRALREILTNFAAEMPAEIVILLHMPVDSPGHLKESLGQFSRLPIIEVENQEPLRQGFIFIPPPGWSATLSCGMITVEHGIGGVPASTINHLFASAAQSYGHHVIGVILTGLLRDGTEGLRAVHEAGGLTIVQDPGEAQYPDMPANAMENLPVTFCLNLVSFREPCAPYFYLK